MTDVDQPTAPTGRGRTPLGRVSPQLAATVLTTVLALVFVVVLGLRIVHPESLSSARAAATSSQHRDDDVLAAARKAALAFLDIDYRDLQPRMDKVISLSTGNFKKEYQNSAVDFAAATRQGQAVSHGQVIRIGISDADADSAIVYIAADQTVSNLTIEEAKKKDPKFKNDQRIWRFQFNMTRVGDRWLVADLKVLL
jgi:hypothetical protein